ncbi:peptidoglycan-binding protein [Novosphingobium panipatense]|uniref:peptidoglycan-binding protein n=1 Tax=Novosphingobium panipatense TaxID=428991 RepID=UPI003613EA56
MIPDKGEAIDPGATDKRIPVIARQLVASDYLAPEAAQGDRYTPAMVQAVRRMQADYGIKPDGVIGSDALGILNLSDDDRAREMAVAMERMRWLERQPAATRIDVNIASGRLSYWRDGKLADTRKAIVGEPDHETPQLGSPIYRLVAIPPGLSLVPSRRTRSRVRSGLSAAEQHGLGGRLDRSAARAQELARPGQVRHEE